MEQVIKQLITLIYLVLVIQEYNITENEKNKKELNFFYFNFNQFI